MSETEHHRGKLIPLQSMGSVEATVKFHLEAIGVTENDLGKYTTSWIQYLNEEITFGYIHNDVLYRIEDKEIDPYDGIADATQNEDGTIDYELRYHNGGGSFNEVMEQALEQC